MTKCDFWVPFRGGHLPMLIIGTDVQVTGGGMGELQDVEMTIRAVSCGAPVYVEVGPREVEQ